MGLLLYCASAILCKHEGRETLRHNKQQKQQETTVIKNNYDRPAHCESETTRKNKQKNLARQFVSFV